MDTQEVTTRVKAVKVKSEGHKKDGTAWAIYDVDTDDGHFGILFDIPRGVLAMKLQGQMAKIQYHIEIGDKTNPKTGEPYKNKVVDSLESAGDVPVPATTSGVPAPTQINALVGPEATQLSYFYCKLIEERDDGEKIADEGDALLDRWIAKLEFIKPITVDGAAQEGLTKVGEVDLGDDIPF